MVSLRENKKLFAGLLISMFTTVGCGGVTFDTPTDDDVANLNTGISFPYSSKIDTFKQDDLLENQVTLNFQVFNKDGLALRNLKENDFKIFENNQSVENFRLISKNDIVSKADIVFVIDKTGSMEDEINGVKQNVRKFVNQLQSVNILANLCLVTFDDKVNDKCLSFQADDPTTPNNENLDSFLDRLERVQAKGGGDNNENQLAGLVSAAEETPWRANAQRITIMITDENFSHTGDPGEAGRDAKSYPITYDMLKSERITNYIVGPRLPGYSSPFDGTPALALAENFFDIKDLAENGDLEEVGDSVTKRSFGDILTEIASSLTTEYTITYNINENGLNPNLPVNSRNSEVKLNDYENETIEMKPITATFPDGHPVARSTWTLSQAVSNVNNMKVYINNVLTSSSNYSMIGNAIRFSPSPAASSYIKVEYASKNLSGGLNLKQIRLATPNVENTKLLVYYNGILADGLDYVISKSPNGKLSLISIVPDALDNNDKYLIEQNGGLTVTFDLASTNINVK